MANRLSVTDQNGKTKQIQVYDESELQQYDEAELIVHITRLHGVLGPETCPTTPRHDASREELIARVLDLQRRAFHCCEVALGQEALNLSRVSETVDLDAPHSSPQIRKKAPQKSINSQPRNPTVNQDDNNQRLDMLYATVEDLRRKVDQHCLRNTNGPSGGGQEALLQHSRNLIGEVRDESRDCKAAIRQEREAREGACSSLAQQWRNAFAEEKQTREMFEKKMTSALERCDRLIRDEHVGLTQLRSELTMQISDLTKVVKSEVSAVMINTDEVRSVSRSEMQNFEKSLQQLANRSAQELNSLWSSIQKLQKSSQEEVDARSEGLKQVQEMIADESRQYEQAMRREAQEREDHDRQLQESWRSQAQETQKVREEAARQVIECGAALQDDFNIERTKIAEQVCELMKGLQQTCEAFDRAMKQLRDQQGKNPGQNNIVQELGDISNHLAGKSKELMQSQERARAERGNFDKFAKASQDHPNTARTWYSPFTQGNSLDHSKYTSKPMLPHFGESSKRLDGSDLLPGTRLSAREARRSRSSSQEGSNASIMKRSESPSRYAEPRRVLFAAKD